MSLEKTTIRRSISGKLVTIMRDKQARRWFIYCNSKFTGLWAGSLDTIMVILERTSKINGLFTKY